MKSMLKRDLLKQFIPVALIAIVAAVVLAGAALAAKPTHATVSVNSTSGASSTNLVAGNNLVFSGCGYTAGSNVTIVVISPFATSFSGAPVDTTGCFSSSQWGYTALMSGSYTVNIYQATDKRNPSGTLTFQVN